MPDRHIADPGAAALSRLCTLAELDDPAQAALAAEIQRARAIQPRRELLSDGGRIEEPVLILDGWAAAVRYLADGRRQIVKFVLPGDVIGLSDQEPPVAGCTVTAFTPMLVCSAPPRGVSPALDRAYAASRALDEAQLLAQITRLGRLSAQERIVDLFLELLERLELAGLASSGRFAFPLTQETLADALGLTSVHVNRTLQQARRAGELEWTGRELLLHDPEALRRSVGRRVTQVITLTAV